MFLFIKKETAFSVNTFENHIDDDEQVIVNYCDFSMDWDYSNFEKFVNETECDGLCGLLHRISSSHVRWR